MAGRSLRIEQLMSPILYESHLRYSFNRLLSRAQPTVLRLYCSLQAKNAEDVNFRDTPVTIEKDLTKMRYRCVSASLNAGRCLEILVTFIDRRLESGGHRWEHRCPDDAPTSIHP
jgi:hypothetical protein